VEKLFLNQITSNSSSFLVDSRTRFPVLTMLDGSLHPSAAAFSNLAWHLDPNSFWKRVEIKPGVTAYLFRNVATSVAVLMRKSGTTADCKLPGGFLIAREDLFGNPLKAGVTIGETVVYTTAPSWLYDIESVVRGSWWPFQGWLVEVLAGVLTIVVMFITVRRFNKPKPVKKGSK